MARAAVYTGPTIDKPDLTIAYTASSGSKPFPLYGGPINNPTSDMFGLAGLKFSASSSNGSAADTTVCDLTLTLTAKTGHTIDSFDWTEGGSYALTGTGSNSVSVYPSTFKISVLAINGTTLPTPLTNSTTPLTFPSGNVFTTTDTLPDSGNWSGTASIDLEDLFGITGITQISIEYQNIFTASSSSGGSASITKSYVDVSPTMYAVPEPASLSMLAATGLLCLRRKRR